MNSKKAEELSKKGLTRDDRAVMEKKSLTMEDIKGAVLDDPMGTPGAPGGNLAKSIVVVVFCLLLFATGIFIAVFTSYTVVGIIIGIALIIAAIAIPVFALRR